MSISTRHRSDQLSPLTARTAVRLASPECGRRILATPDHYTARLSPFDLVAKMQGRGPHHVEAYLDHARAQVLPWRDDERAALARAVTAVGRRLAELELCPPLPPVIEVIKSTLAEEGGMNGYTRGTAVVLRQGVVDARTFAHELFHLISRHNHELRRRLYSDLGVRVVEHQELPPALEQRRITNPDAPANDAVIEVTHGDRRRASLMIIVARDRYRGGPLRGYLHPVLAPLDGLHRRPEILTPDEVDGLWQQLGTNTQAVTHPEEISAEHFAMLLTGQRGLARPDLVAAMWRTLKEASG